MPRAFNFNSEARVLPAVSLGAGVDQPYGYQSGGTEADLKFVASKSIGSFGTSYVPCQLHVNTIYYHNFDPLSLANTRERQNRYLVGICYSQPVTNDAVLVANVYREILREGTQAQNIVQVGARYQLDPQTVLSGSIGTGFADRSPAFAALIGFQHTELAASIPLGVWSRDEVARVKFEDVGCFGPGPAYGLERRLSPDCLEVLGEVVG